MVRILNELAKTRILVIDDGESIRYAVDAGFEYIGDFDVQFAEDGINGIKTSDAKFSFGRPGFTISEWDRRSRGDSEGSGYQAARSRCPNDGSYKPLERRTHDGYWHRQNIA